MKKLLFFIAAFPIIALAEGPRFQHKDTFIQQEVENIYQDIRAKPTLPQGASGQMLLSGGTNASPYWGGKPIFQVVVSSVITSTSTTSGTYIKTGLEYQLPRVSTTSCVEIIATLGHMQNATSGASAVATLFRDGAEIAPANGRCEVRSATAPDRFTCTLISYDCPPSSSQNILYSARFRTDGSGTAQIGTGNVPTQYMILKEIGP
jgi:hypothetical protein